MPKVPSRSGRHPEPPSALDVFTNREGLIHSFNNLLETKTPQENNVLVFFGEGGIGKTTLSQKLQQGLIDSGAAHRSARLDFASSGNTEPDVALFRLKEAFRDLPFPIFSIALAHYAGRFHPELSFLSNRAAFVEGAGPYAELIDGAIELANSTPGLSLALSAIKVVTEGKNRLDSWYRHRAEPRLRNLANFTGEQLLTLLPELWAEDFRDGLAASANTDFLYEGGDWNVPCPVIFLDTYEALWHGGLGSRGGKLRHLREEWLVALVRELPEVLWVISGRDKLKWEPYDPVWSQCCEQHLVGTLSDEDATSFLYKRGITVPAIVAAILHQAAGVPFYLEMEAQLFYNTAPEQRIPELFGGTREDVIDRLLSHLEASEKETMRLMACFGQWDAALFREAVKEFGTGYPATACDQFGEGWSIEQPAAGIWQLHNEMVHHLQADVKKSRPDLYRSWHQWGFDRFDAPLAILEVKDITVAHAECLRRALAHAWELRSANEVAEWFVPREELLAKGTVWRALVPVLEAYQGQVEGALGPEHPAVATSLNNLAWLLDTLARYEEAEPLYRRALAIKEAAYGPEHPEVAASLNNLAGLLNILARYEEAEPLFRRALAITEAALGPEHPNVACGLNNLARLLATLARDEEAEPLSRRALAIIEAAHGPEHPTVADRLYSHAVLLATLERYEEAEPLSRRALSITEAANGPEHPTVADRLNIHAVLLHALARDEEAVPLYHRALQVLEKVLGTEHPTTVRVSGNLKKSIEAAKTAVQQDSN